MTERKSIFTTKQQEKNGDNAESLFPTIAEKQGYKIILKTCNYENIHEHVDFRLHTDFGTTPLKVEVKAMKALIRNSVEGVQDTYTWIELHGVRPNDEGWLYGGKSDIIAIQIKTGFLLFNREELASFIRDYVERKKPKIWSRYPRADKIFKIETEILKTIPHQEWSV